MMESLLAMVACSLVVLPALTVPAVVWGITKTKERVSTKPVVLSVLGLTMILSSALAIVLMLS
jgi:hypothetical protein